MIGVMEPKILLRPQSTLLGKPEILLSPRTLSSSQNPAKNKMSSYLKRLGQNDRGSDKHHFGGGHSHWGGSWREMIHIYMAEKKRLQSGYMVTSATNHLHTTVGPTVVCFPQVLAISHIIDNQSINHFSATTGAVW